MAPHPPLRSLCPQHTRFQTGSQFTFPNKFVLFFTDFCTVYPSTIHHLLCRIDNYQSSKPCINNMKAKKTGSVKGTGSFFVVGKYSLFYPVQSTRRELG